MRTALLLIDIQHDYFPGGPLELVGIDGASENAKELLSFFRQKQWPTFHIQHVMISDSAPVFRANTRGVEIHEKVKPLPADVIIQKHRVNSFLDTPLLEELKNAGVARVVICGAMSHMCIDATTRAAADLGFNCVVIHDACATRDLEFQGKKIPAEAVHRSFMAALGSGYAKVMSLKDYLLDAQTE